MPFDHFRAIAARLAQPLCLALVVAVAWFLLDSAIFRSGFYYAGLAEPDSNAGSLTMRLMRAQRDATAEPSTVLVLGDSRVGEGFSSRLAQSVAPSLNFVNVAVPGSRPRTWYYLLREMRQRDVPFDAVVVGVPYRHLGGGVLADWRLDATFMAPLVGLGDAWSFPDTFASDSMRHRAMQTVWLPALTMQKDFQALVSAPLKRWRSLRSKRWWLENGAGYEGRDERMPELVFNAGSPGQWQVVDWKDATDKQRQIVESHLQDLAYAPRAENDEFLGEWLEKVLELTREAGVPLIVYPNPRGPYPELLPKDEGLPPSLAALAKQPGAVVLPADFLARLEAPEFFFDVLHANREGRRITSEAVAREVAKVLGREAANETGDGR